MTDAEIKLIELIETKENIKNALTNKGLDLSNTTFKQYHTKINQIVDAQPIYLKDKDGELWKQKLIFNKSLSNPSRNEFFTGWQYELDVEDSPTVNKLYENVNMRYSKVIDDTSTYGGSINTLAQDDDFVYAAGVSTRRVRKYSKVELNQVAQSDLSGASILSLDTNQNTPYVYYLDQNIVRAVDKNLVTVASYDLSSFAGTPVKVLITPTIAASGIVEVVVAISGSVGGQNKLVRFQEGVFSNNQMVLVPTNNTIDVLGPDPLKQIASDDRYIYFTQEFGSLRRYDRTTNIVSSVISNNQGIGSNGGVIAIESSDSTGGFIYVSSDNLIYKILKSNTTIAGSIFLSGNIEDIKIAGIGRIIVGGASPLNPTLIETVTMEIIGEAPFYGGTVRALVATHPTTNLEGFIFAGGTTLNRVRKYLNSFDIGTVEVFT
jgi:hypothetical protein